MKIKMLGTLSIEMLQYVKSKILGEGGGGGDSHIERMGKV